MSNLQTYYHFKLDFQKMDQHTGGRWLIHSTKHHKARSARFVLVSPRNLISSTVAKTPYKFENEGEQSRYHPTSMYWVLGPSLRLHLGTMVNAVWFTPDLSVTAKLRHISGQSVGTDFCKRISVDGACTKDGYQCTIVPNDRSSHTSQQRQNVGSNARYWMRVILTLVLINLRIT